MLVRAERVLGGTSVSAMGNRPLRPASILPPGSILRAADRMGHRGRVLATVPSGHRPSCSQTDLPSTGAARPRGRFLDYRCTRPRVRVAVLQALRLRCAVLQHRICHGHDEVPMMHRKLSCALAASFALSCAVGCATSVGPSVGAMLNDSSTWTTGPSIGYRGYLGSSRGPVLGGDAEYRAAPHSWDARINAAAGYGVLPLAHKSAVGFEGTVQPGVARGQLDPNHHWAFVWGWQLALPIRVSPAKAPWEQNTLAEPTHVLVPSIRFSHWVPFRGEPEKLHHDLSFALSYRFHLWPAIEP